MKLANIDARVTIPDLKRADDRLSGHADLMAKLTGTVDHPDAKTTITVTDARALGRPIPRLVAQVTASDLTGLIDARATLTGTVDGKPAEGALRIAKQANGNWLLNDLNLRVGSVTLQGGVAVTDNRLAEGRLKIDAGNLDDLSPLVLTKLAGQLRADATFTVADGGQNGALSAQANGVKIGTSALERLDAKLRVTDVYRRPVIDGDLAIDRARVAGEFDLANSVDRQGRGERQRHRPHRSGARLRARRARPSGRRRQYSAGAIETDGATRQTPARVDEANGPDAA